MGAAEPERSQPIGKIDGKTMVLKAGRSRHGRQNVAPFPFEHAIISPVNGDIAVVVGNGTAERRLRTDQALPGELRQQRMLLKMALSDIGK